jgi:hypothetical protein
MEITNITPNGKTDLSIFGSKGIYNDFIIKINGRFEFSIFAEIVDCNREEIYYHLSEEMQGENGLFNIKTKYFNIISEKVGEYVQENADEYRDDPQDWEDYYSEMRNDKADY